MRPESSSFTVTVTGADSVRAPLSWGQRALWQTSAWMRDEASYFNMSIRLPAPPGTGLKAIGTAVAELVTRHDALRTRFTGDPLEQVADPQGSVRVLVHEVDHPEVDDVVELLQEQRRQVRFDPGADWPMLVHVVSTQDGPAELVLVLSHLTVDGAASRLLAEELGSLLRGEPLGQRPGQPWAIAEFERTSKAAARDARARAFWRDGLADAPLTMFPGPRSAPADPRFRLVKLESVAAASAAEALAQRHRLSVSSVFLAATMALLSLHTGQDDVAMLMIVGNRFDASRRRVVSTFSQDGLLRARLTGLSFDGVVRAAFAAMMRCLTHGYYEPLAMKAARAAYPAELNAFFNDVRPGDRYPQAVGDPAALREMCARSRVWADGGWPRMDAAFFVTVAAGQAPGSVQVHLLADTTVAPLDRMGDLLLGFERLLVASAAADVPADRLREVTGVPDARTP